MTEILKTAGAVLALICALMLSREYEKFERGRVRLAEGFLLLLRDMRSKVDRFLTPESGMLCDFENDALAECGYLASAEELGISDAFFKESDRLSLPEDVKKLLSGIFRDFGREYREGALKILDGGIRELEKLIASMKGEKERSVKLVRTVSVAAALGAVILLA